MAGEKSVAFVAERQIPPSPPPVRTGGALGWARDNLFSGVFNSVATLLSLAFVAYILAMVVPWLFLDSVWNASSLQGCREVDDGACLAVINERFLQFVFGFYPEELRWRPILAFVLLFVAIWPALFTSAPRKLLIFSALYPLLAYWLIWGGSLWGPVGAVVGIAIGWACIRFLPSLARGRLDEGFAFLAAVGAGILGAALWWLFCVIAFEEALSAVLEIGLEPVESARLGGFLLSTIIGVSGIAGSLPIGIVLALGRQSNLILIKGVCVGFIEFIRGVPLITLLFVAWLLLSYFLPPGTEFDLILRVVIMVTAFASAYMAEVIRGGLAGTAGRAVRGRRFPRPRLLEVDAPHNPAAGAQDFHSGDRQHLHRPVQGHDPRHHHRAAGPGGPAATDPRRPELERHRVGTLRLHRAVLLHLLFRHVALFHVSGTQPRCRTPIGRAP